MEPLDLTQAPPRSPYMQIGGLYMLARTIDKLRAELPGGNVGDFHYSGFSESLMDALAINHDDILAAVAQAESDDDVLAWVLTHTDAAAFPAMNEHMTARVIDDSNRERLTKKYPVIEQHPEVSKLFDVMVLDDAAVFATV